MIDKTGSPNYLDMNDNAVGVRRLNKRPLYIIAGFGSLFMLAFFYTIYVRQHSSQGVAHSKITPINSTARAVPQIQPQTSIPHKLVGDLAAEVKPLDTPTRVPNVAESDEYKARLQMIARIEDSRTRVGMAALSAPLSVQGFENLGRRKQIEDSHAASGVEHQGLSPQVSQSFQRSEQQIVPPLGAGFGTGAGGYGFGEVSTLDGSQQSLQSSNGQGEKEAFLKRNNDEDTYLSSGRVSRRAKIELKAGTVIPGVLISGINSDLPGQIVGQVRRNVYDTVTGHFLLIPAGAKLIGRYDSQVTMGQNRVLIGWNRIIFPDGSSISLKTMPGVDQGGYAGFNDLTNNHYLKLFGSALMLSAFSAGIQLSQPQTNNGNYNSQQIVGGALGIQLGQVGMNLANRNMNIQPTLKIRPGYEFNIMVTKDMILSPWK